MDIFLKIPFRERGRKRKKTSVEERSIDWLPSARAETGDHACPEWGSNWQPW